MIYNIIAAYCSLLFASIPVCEGQENVKIIAHRGASAEAPENTLIAFEKALQAGAMYVEMDVRTSSDDSLMVIHDETVDRTTNGSGKVAEMDYESLRSLSAGFTVKFGNKYRSAVIPTLFESLQIIKQNNGYAVIEPKSVSNLPLLEIIESAGMQNRAFIISYNFDKLTDLHHRNNQIKLLFLSNGLTSGDVIATGEAKMYGVGAGLSTPNHLIDFAHDHGLEFWKGVVNDPAKMEFYRDAGVDGIFTDYPDIPELMWTDNLIILRNPFRLYLEGEIVKTEQYPDIGVFDISGNEIFLWENDGSNLFRWFPGNKKTGIYFIFVYLNKKTEVHKVIYQKNY